MPERPDAQHYFRKREARSGVVQCDAIPARERHLQAAAHAKAVHHRGRGEGQRAQLVHRVPPEPCEVDRLVGRLEVYELVHVGAGDVVVLRRADDQPLGARRGDLVQCRSELLERLARERVGRFALLVECEPGEPVAVLLVAPVPHSASTSIAPPNPPPMQIAAMPRLALLRSSVLNRCSTMRAPEAPTGWPSATAPPSTFSFAMSSSPSAPGRPSASRQ